MDRLAAMEVLVRVIDTGSLSQAARQLHIGQPSISKTITQLEKRLGVRLLTRTTHRVTPTEAGQSFYKHAKRTLEEADEAERAARGDSAGLTGRSPCRHGAHYHFGVAVRARTAPTNRQAGTAGLVVAADGSLVDIPHRAPSEREGARFHNIHGNRAGATAPPSQSIRRHLQITSAR
jgi:molybdenum-dependent DNA-binding transcriptional regulator ModE